MKIRVLHKFFWHYFSNNFIQIQIQAFPSQLNYWMNHLAEWYSPKKNRFIKLQYFYASFAFFNSHASSRQSNWTTFAITWHLNLKHIWRITAQSIFSTPSKAMKICYRWASRAQSRISALGSRQYAKNGNAPCPENTIIFRWTICVKNSGNFRLDPIASYSYQELCFQIPT